MSMPAAVVAAAVVTSAVIQSNAQKRAADKAASATRDANQLQKDQYWQTREDNLPLMDVRNALLPRVQELAMQDSNITAQDVLSYPGYQFGMDQGTRALQGSSAARGSLHSGATLKALNKFGNDYATTKFGDVFNIKQTALGNNFNRAMGAAGMGQSGVQQTQQAGSNYANNVGQNLLGNANFQGAAGMAQANTLGNLLNRGSSYIGSGSGYGGQVGQQSNMFTNRGWGSNLANGYSNDDVYWN